MYCRKGLHLSVLRVLASNRAACSDAPVLELEERSGMQKFFNLDGSLAALPRRAAAFIQSQTALIWPPTHTDRYQAPKVTAACANS